MSEPQRLPRPKAGLLDIAAYVGGKSTVEGVAEPIKLSSNETALGCSPLARTAYLAAADQLHLYPDGHCTVLRQAVSDRFKLEQDRLIFTAGSDEVFDLLLAAEDGFVADVLDTGQQLPTRFDLGLHWFSPSQKGSPFPASP